MLSVAGVAVTSAGSPDTETATVPLKEFNAFASTETAAPDAPLVTVADAGITLNEKSGGTPWIVSASVTEWVMLPDIPVKVMVGAADATLDAAVTVMVCGVPGTRLTVAGAAATPAGSPEMETATVPLNEFKAFASTEIAAPGAPLVTVADAGVTLNEKSGGGDEREA